MPDSQQQFRPEITTLTQLFDYAAGSFATRPLFGTLQGEEIQWTSYGEFGRLVDAFRSGLHKLGVQRGDAIAMISSNRVEWAVAAHAAFGLGAHVVPLYEVQGREDWHFILEDSSATLCLVANDMVAQRLQPLRAALPKLRDVVNFEAPLTAAHSYAGLIAYGTEHPYAKQAAKPSDIAVLIYTSGTTGRPKGVMLTHHSLASNITALLSTLVVEGNDSALSFLPWAHIFGGCIELNLVIITGSSTVLVPDPMLLPHYLPRAKPTVVLGVPRVWNKIYDGVSKLMAGQPVFQQALSARAKQRRGEAPSGEELEALASAEKDIFPMIRGVLGGRVRYAASGAAALSREVAEFMDTLGIAVYEGYGMTETGGVATSPPMNEIRLGSVGKALPGMRIVIDESAPGAGPEEGELVIYGPCVMAGYHNQPEATRATMTEDGGFRTGDMGRIDADGYVYITGRVKELYKLSNGRYVAPVPLEETLALSPYISQAVVYGSGKPHNVALLVPDLPAVAQWAKEQGIDADGEKLLSLQAVLSMLEAEVDKANRRFKDFERVKRFVIEPEELTSGNGMLTQTLKLKRRTFQDKYGDVLESLYPRKNALPPPRASYIRELQVSPSES